MNTLTKAAVQGAACGLMVGVVLLLGGRLWRPATVEAQAKQGAVAEVVRARRIEVVDEAGRTRALLSGSVVSLALFDAAGKSRLFLATAPDGSPLVSLSDAAGEPRLSLGVASNGNTAVKILDVMAKSRAEFSVTPDGDAFLTLFDVAGKNRAVLTVASDGSPSLALRDAAEQMRVGLALLPNAQGIALLDAAGKVTWKAP